MALSKELAEEIRRKLEAPFPEKDIEWRLQRIVRVGNSYKAIMLAYLTSRAVMQRLDDVFGVFGWQDQYERWGENGVKCTIYVRDPDSLDWVKKTDGADDTDIEATKGGFSNSFKRACVKLGIGRYLYNLDETWCDILDQKPSEDYIYVSSRDKDGNYIQGYVLRPKLPAWALPQGDAQGQSFTVIEPEAAKTAVESAVTPQESTASEEPKEVKMALDAQINAIKKMANMLEAKEIQADALSFLTEGKDVDNLTFDEAVEAIKKGNELISGAFNK